MRSTFGWYRNTVKREDEAQALHSCKASGLLVVSTVRVWAPEDSLWVSQAEQAHRGLEVLGRPPNPLVSRPDVIRVRCSPWDLNGSYTWRRRGHFFLPLSPDLWGVSTILTYFLLSTLSLWECHFIFSAYYSRVVFFSSFLDQAFLHLHLFSLFPLWSLSTTQSCRVVLGST